MDKKILLTPSYDNKIYQKYSKKTIKNKIENKLQFQEDLGLIVERKIPILCITIDITKKSGGELLEETIEGILTLDVQLLIRGAGTEQYQKLFSDLAVQHKNKIRIVSDTEENIRKTYAASDIALVFSTEEEHEEEISNYLSYGVIPVLPEKHSQSLPIVNYNPIEENGNAFVYKKNNKWIFFATLIRALENFLFPYDWELIQKNAIESVTQI
jgi:glycogen synthase